MKLTISHAIKNHSGFGVYFYGGHITQSEKATAISMVGRNSINFNVSKHNVTFW